MDSALIRPGSFVGVVGIAGIVVCCLYCWCWLLVLVVGVIGVIDVISLPVMCWLLLLVHILPTLGRIGSTLDIFVSPPC